MHCRPYCVHTGHSFATGGSNAAEHWFDHNHLADSLQPNRWGNYRNIGARTEESCTQYNALKVARHLYTWSADAKMADYFERAFLNGILGNQNVINDTTVDLEYMLPFGDTAQVKPFAPVGADNNKFPCCWGTLAEQFAKLQDSIYFKTPDNTTLFVNMFESSTVQWDAASGLSLEQVATFPADEAHTTTLTVTVAGGSDAAAAAAAAAAIGARTVALRVPWWATDSAGNSVVVNGGAPVPASEIKPSTYLLITRVWKTGDTVAVHFPMSLTFEHVDDPRPEFAGYGAVLYGPLLLAGLTNDALFVLGNNSISDVIKRNSTADELSFEAYVPRVGTTYIYCVCVRAHVRTCARACVCAFVCVCVCMCMFVCCIDLLLVVRLYVCICMSMHLRVQASAAAAAAAARAFLNCKPFAWIVMLMLYV